MAASNEEEEVMKMESDLDDSFSEDVPSDDNDSDFVPSLLQKKKAVCKSKPRRKNIKAEKNEGASCDDNCGKDDDCGKPKAVKRKTAARGRRAKKLKIENEEKDSVTSLAQESSQLNFCVAIKSEKNDNDNNFSEVSINCSTSSESCNNSLPNSSTDSMAGNGSQIFYQEYLKSRPWKDEEVVAEVVNIPVYIANNVITLLNQECTLPFIIRYRKEMTGGLHPDKLREIQASYEEVKHVRKKVENILKTVKHEKFDEKAAALLMSAKNMEEVEMLYAPFKPGSKKTLAERSKKLGLEPIALQLLEGKASLRNANISNLIKPQKGLETEKDILLGIQHIIADAVAKNRHVLDFVQQKSQDPWIRVSSSKSASAEKLDRQAFVEGKSTDNFKYENYFELSVMLKNIAPHQVMAVNRGEKQKVLAVKIEIPFKTKKAIADLMWSTFFYKKYLEHETYTFMKTCFEDSYDRLVEPHICRQIRSYLTKKAEKESIAIFCSNVKSLLLTPPVRGKTVIGIDPGFSHGCKTAAVSSKGDVLETDVIYPHSKGQMFGYDAEKLKHMISMHGVEIIAIGNGTACRETEAWLSDLNRSKYFYPFEIKYCIVNESGVSIYSVSKEAEVDLPDMDPNMRSAVGIARRLQDPLLEYVKVEPKHLGVGMYQHDIPEAQLKKALDSIVEECVSFVGVDLNVCPEVLLRKIAGLSASRAKQIVEWRSKKWLLYQPSATFRSKRLRTEII